MESNLLLKKKKSTCKHCNLKEHGHWEMTVPRSSLGRSQRCLAQAWLLSPRLVKGKGEIQAKIELFKCFKKISEPIMK